MIGAKNTEERCMVDHFEFQGKKYGICTKVKYLGKYGSEKTGTVLQFDEDYFGEKVLIGNSAEDYKEYRCEEVNLKEFEKFAIKEVLGVDTSINPNDLKSRDSFEKVLLQREEKRKAELATAVRERNEVKNKLEIERQKNAKKGSSSLVGVIAMWVCIILAFTTGFAAIMADAKMLAAACFIGFASVGVWCEKHLLNDATKMQMQKDIEDKEKKRLRGGYKCPNCGQKAGHPIGALSKGASIGFWGLASNKIGKTYKCENCDYMW